MSKMFWKTLAGSLGYLVVALSCLIQWRSPHAWASIDGLSAGYFGLRFLGSLHSIISSLGAFRSRPIREEWWGALDSDPEGPRWVMLLMAFDLLVFLDYGHWRLVPLLVKHALRTTGLLLYTAVMAWQIWTDEYLARYFRRAETPIGPMNHGPYRYVRHPRYVAAIVGKVAMALTFASFLGWLLVIAWGGLLLNKIRVEEKHLRKLFGSGYESYARTTAKIIPGIY